VARGVHHALSNAAHRARASPIMSSPLPQ
jgi:hypothetical protein